MVHTIIVPSSRQVQFEIPNEYVGKEVEIIAFTKGEGMKEKTTSSKKPSDFFGSLSKEEGQKCRIILPKAAKNGKEMFNRHECANRWSERKTV